MKIHFKAALTIITCTMIIVSVNLSAQTVTKEKTLEVMEMVNKYFTDKWPDPAKDMNTNIAYQSNTWTRAIYYEGLMGLYSITKNESYLLYALRWGESNKWSLPEGIKSGRAENLCCGQTYLDIYLLDRYKDARIKQIKTCVDTILAHNKTDEWDSVDDIQMAMPVFARLGDIHANEKLFDLMHQAYLYTKLKQAGSGLYNPEDHLWWYSSGFKPPYKEPNGENCYTSRGNGWVMAAFVRSMEFVSKGSYKKEYETVFKEMAEAILPLQREDGFWNVSLKDPNHFGGKELTGTSLITYALAWGIKEHILDKKEYLPVVMKAWNAIITDAVRPDGSLGYVQGTGDSPETGQPVTFETKPDYEDFAIGCFLLAGTEMHNLIKSMEPKEKIKKEKPKVEEAAEAVQDSVKPAKKSRDKNKPEKDTMQKEK